MVGNLSSTSLFDLGKIAYARRITIHQLETNFGTSHIALQDLGIARGRG